MDEEAEDTLWFIKTGDSEVGPVTTTEIQAMLKTGELSARTQVRREDESEWTNIGQRGETGS
ncbi:MAG: DUF4339 domain-containing protein [Proteobacteria bacterium]|nr:DUF4339 domain-containing protein [Pseudomonadota bacterium]